MAARPFLGGTRDGRVFSRLRSSVLSDQGFSGRNKRSIALDLKDADDIQTFQKRDATADGLIQGFRPAFGRMTKPENSDIRRSREGGAAQKPPGLSIGTRDNRGVGQAHCLAGACHHLSMETAVRPSHRMRAAG